MTEQHAIKRARQLALDNGETQYVVHEDYDDRGRFQAFHVTDAYELATFFAGISESRIIFCTDDD